jgi:hypothetical protein
MCKPKSSRLCASLKNALTPENPEGNETVTNCNALKMPAPDGKMRLTNVADTVLILNMLAGASAKDISAATKQVKVPWTMK